MQGLLGVEQQPAEALGQQKPAAHLVAQLSDACKGVPECFQQLAAVKEVACQLVPAPYTEQRATEQNSVNQHVDLSCTAEITWNRRKQLSATAPANQPSTTAGIIKTPTQLIFVTTTSLTLVLWAERQQAPPKPTPAPAAGQSGWLPAPQQPRLACMPHSPAQHSTAAVRCATLYLGLPFPFTSMHRMC